MHYAEMELYQFHDTKLSIVEREYSFLKASLLARKFWLFGWKQDVTFVILKCFMVMQSESKPTSILSIAPQIVKFVAMTK